MLNAVSPEIIIPDSILSLLFSPSRCCIGVMMIYIPPGVYISRRALIVFSQGAISICKVQFTLRQEGGSIFRTR